jgi:hypothetical protein
MGQTHIKSNIFLLRIPPYKVYIMKIKINSNYFLYCPYFKKQLYFYSYFYIFFDFTLNYSQVIEIFPLVFVYLLLCWPLLRTKSYWLVENEAKP